jgi:hypothetical protein
MYELVRENLKECADYAQINKLIFIDAELFRDNVSDEFKDFIEDNSIEEICQMFSLEDKCIPFMELALNENILAQQLCDFGCNSFIAEIEMPIWRDFNFSRDGEYKSCLSTHQSQLKWIYGSTITNLITRMKKESEKFFDIQVNEARKNGKTTKKN